MVLSKKGRKRISQSTRLKNLTKNPMKNPENAKKNSDSLKKGFKEGRIVHNKGKTKENYEPLNRTSKKLKNRIITWGDKISDAKIGIPSNLSKEGRKHKSELTRERNLKDNPVYKLEVQQKRKEIFSQEKYVEIIRNNSKNKIGKEKRIWNSFTFDSIYEMELAKILLKEPKPKQNCDIKFKLDSKTIFIDFFPNKNDNYFHNTYIELHPYDRDGLSHEEYFIQRQNILGQDKPLKIITKYYINKNTTTFYCYEKEEEKIVFKSYEFPTILELYQRVNCQLPF